MEYICLSTVSVMEFYRQFCSVLGLEDRGGKPGMFKAMQEQVYSLYKEKRKPLLHARTLRGTAPQQYPAPPGA